MSSAILPAGAALVSATPPSAIAPVRPTPGGVKPPAGVKPEVARAAREFEAIFLRQILTSLEKASRMGSTGSAGSDVYGSMMVGALADAVASAGGVGLAKYVTTSLAHTPAPAPKAPAAPGFPLETPKPTVLQNPSKTSEKGIP